MSNKKLIFIGVGTLLLISAIFIWYFLTHGSITVTLDGNSPVSSNVEFWLSSDNYSKGRTPPQKIRLKTGTYTLHASGDGSDTYVTQFTISGGKNTSVNLTIEKSLSESLIGTTDSGNLTPYQKLFPYYGGSYNISGTLSTDQKSVVDVLITLYHQIPKSDPVSYNKEHDLILAAAKKWLSSNNVPTSVPVTVIDQ